MLPQYFINKQPTLVDYATALEDMVVKKFRLDNPLSTMELSTTIIVPKPVIMLLWKSTSISSTPTPPYIPVRQRFLRPKRQIQSWKQKTADHEARKLIYKEELAFKRNETFGSLLSCDQPIVL